MRLRGWSVHARLVAFPSWACVPAPSVSGLPAVCGGGGTGAGGCCWLCILAVQGHGCEEVSSSALSVCHWRFEDSCSERGQHTKPCCKNTTLIKDAADTGGRRETCCFLWSSPAPGEAASIQLPLLQVHEFDLDFYFLIFFFILSLSSS